MPQLKNQLASAAAGLLIASVLAGCGERSESAIMDTAKKELASGNRAAAIIELKQAIQVAPDNPEYRFLLGSTFADAEEWPAAELELRKAKDLGYPNEKVAALYAKALLETRQYKKLIDEVPSLRVAEPAAARMVSVAVAAAHSQTKNSAAAEAALAQVLADEPEHAPALLLQARMRLAKGDGEAALQIAKAVLGRDAKNVDALQINGEVETYLNGNKVEGKKVFEAVVAQRPGHLEANFGLISILLSEGNVDAAEKLANALAKLKPLAPQTQFLQAQVALTKHDLVRARSHAQRLLQVGPDVPDFLQLAGSVEFEAGALVKAEAHLSKAVGLSPAMAQPRLLLARIHLLSERPAQALTVLAPLLMPGSKDVLAMLLAADVQQQLGDLRSADAFLGRVAQIAPNDPRLRTAMAVSKIAQGQRETGLKELALLAASQSDGMADLALYRARLAGNDLAGAITAIEALEKKLPNQPVAANLRGRVDIFRRDIPGAKRHFERALSIDSAYFPAANSLAYFFVLEGKPEQAIALFESVLKAQPKHVQAALAIAGIQARSGAGKDVVASLIGAAIAMNPSDSSPRLSLVDYFVDQRDLKAAYSAAQAGLAAIPDDPGILERMARIQMASGDTNQAISSYSKLVSIRPSLQAMLGLAAAQLAANNAAAAASTYRRLIDAAGNRPDVQRTVVAEMMKARQHDAALNIAREIQRKQPGDAIGPLLMGDIEASRGRWNEALLNFRLGLGKQRAELVPVRLHATLILAKQDSEAAKFAADWVRSNPRDIGFATHLAEMMLARRDLAGAERQYQEVLKLDGDNGRALNNVAWLQLQQRKPGALAAAERAAARLPTDAAVLDTYAVALAGAGQLPKAIEVMVALSAAHPENLQFQVNLAAMYIKAGDKVRAASILSAVRGHGAKFGNQKEVDRLLKLT